MTFFRLNLLRLALLAAACLSPLAAQIRIRSAEGGPLPAGLAIPAEEPWILSFEVEGGKAGGDLEVKVSPSDPLASFPDDPVTVKLLEDGRCAILVPRAHVGRRFVLAAAMGGQASEPVAFTVAPRDLTRRLPSALLGHLLGFVPEEGRQLNRAARFHGLRDSRRLTVRGPLDDLQLGRTLAERPNLHHLRLGHLEGVSPEGLARALEGLTRLKSLTVCPRSKNFEGRHLDLLAERNPGLQRLSIPDRLLLSGGLPALRERLTHLEVIGLPPFQGSQSGRDGKRGALRACSALKVLEVTDAAWLRDEDLPTALAHLRLVRCGAVTGQALPVSLDHLSVSDCGLFALDPGRQSGLRALVLRTRGRATVGQVQALLAQGKLRKLRVPSFILSGRDLRPVQDRLEELEMLGPFHERMDLRAFPRLEILGLRYPQILAMEDLPPGLRELELHAAYDFTGAGLPAGLRRLLLENCYDFVDGRALPSSLACLEVVECDRLACEGSGSRLELPRSLRELRVSECRRFTMEGLAELLPRLPALETLYVEGWYPSQPDPREYLRHPSLRRVLSRDPRDPDSGPYLVWARPSDGAAPASALKPRQQWTCGIL
jgi:hypothetical protein